MDGQTFDELTRATTQTPTRRGALGVFAGAALSGWRQTLNDDEIRAALVRHWLDITDFETVARDLSRRRGAGVPARRRAPRRAGQRAGDARGLSRSGGDHDQADARRRNTVGHRTDRHVRRQRSRPHAVNIMEFRDGKVCARDDLFRGSLGPARLACAMGRTNGLAAPCGTCVIPSFLRRGILG